jgi:Iap family predicted aminopeptidase
MTLRNNTCALWRRLIPAFLLLSLPFIAFAQEAPGNSSGAIRLSTADEIKSEFNSVPCKNGDRLKAVKALFEKMGANPEAIMIEKGRGVENVIVRKPGANGSSEKIVIGAHYDKTSQGCGAIDNWTGVVTIAHLYRAVKDFPTNKTLIFAAFGEEEQGLVGSSGMTDKIKKEQVDEYCAMINIDSLGLGAPQVADNMSAKKLIGVTEALAKEMKIPFGHGVIAGADSDSTSFNRKKIPALTIHAMTSDWPKILHSNNDQASKINMESVYLSYRLAVALLAKIDATDCLAFREDKKKK